MIVRLLPPRWRGAPGWSRMPETMSIDIVSGIRDQPGAPRHLGGSNRTIIKQAYEMLVSDRTALAKQTIGKLVTLDKIYELVEGNLSTEKQKDISDVMERFK